MGRFTDVRQRGGRPKLHEIGADPDPRFTFANERTFLARNRTSLALIAGGLAVAQLLDVSSRWARLAIAAPLIALGAALALTSYRHWESNERALRLARPLPYSRLPKLLGAGIGAVAVICAAVLVADAIAR
jgi:putative membrane protein